MLAETSLPHAQLVLHRFCFRSLHRYDSKPTQQAHRNKLITLSVYRFRESKRYQRQSHAVVQHHQLVHGHKPHLGNRVTSSSWSPAGCPLLLLTATSNGLICAWTPPGASKACWACHAVTTVDQPIGRLSEVSSPHIIN